MTRYTVLFEPTFHPRVEVEVAFAPEGEWVRIQTEGREERVRLSVEQGVRFLEAMEALAPEHILDGREGGIDGCTFSCAVSPEWGKRHTFRAWCPGPEKSPQQHAFISLVHLLALEVTREPTTAALLKQLRGYYGGS
ncbi:hypothetical protein [Hyalangium rubrum]|uniref:Uncharacterized protein n=1 Tax=Hyalangium rubrum TaxID=3103134 RepID=A0ABU5HIL9_9BACT|nr:hypothetical protein [Hyalangium sp. s54d21]MDY7233300.1 hypothetical protein [Hyalangium sp. s54d21]